MLHSQFFEPQNRMSEAKDAKQMSHLNASYPYHFLLNTNKGTYDETAIWK